MRQFACVEVSRMDALLLRDAMRPLAKVEPYDGVLLVRFCEKLYDGILKLEANKLDAINIALEEHEAVFINHFVGNEDWGGAMALLEQTWLVLYELRYQSRYPRPPGDAEAATPAPPDAATPPRR